MKVPRRPCRCSNVGTSRGLPHHFSVITRKRAPAPIFVPEPESLNTARPESHAGPQAEHRHGGALPGGRPSGPPRTKAAPGAQGANPIDFRLLGRLPPASPAEGLVRAVRK